MRRTSLPASLGDLFTTAEARAAGVPASRLRAMDLERPHHGVRLRSLPAAPHDREEPGPETLLRERARRYAPRMGGDEFFSHVTAAVIWGLPLPFAVVRGRPIVDGA
ncbi:type IV toxin-antitoxin system AbiEi family antitoxin domain-containing protein [Microbacterium sp. No. 7]|uniref:type IV toxin-antitoxin system AbiEi family antitoxin domain-containing protein n=1 Tax=Microbacterium sp. No. 7 TaxID=1714373 RepID=UPI000AC083D6|nr:type IV toxin-antitoxin system AbiEi family antitoxin domain-containing protein [Microbacterium sp. No. 7]